MIETDRTKLISTTIILDPLVLAVMNTVRVGVHEAQPEKTTIGNTNNYSNDKESFGGSHDITDDIGGAKKDLRMQDVQASGAPTKGSTILLQRKVKKRLGNVNPAKHQKLPYDEWCQQEERNKQRLKIMQMYLNATIDELISQRSILGKLTETQRDEVRYEWREMRDRGYEFPGQKPVKKWNRPMKFLNEAKQWDEIEDTIAYHQKCEG